MPYPHATPAMPTKSRSLKNEAHALIDKLPDSATWEDVAQQVEQRASIERTRVKPRRKKGDGAILDANAERLNAEAKDVLDYQRLP